MKQNREERIALFIQDAYLSMAETLFEYSEVQLKLIAVFDAGTKCTEFCGVPVISIDRINETDPTSFDVIVIFADLEKEIGALLRKLYPTITDSQILRDSEAAKIFLSPKGKMYYLKYQMEKNYPRGQFSTLKLGDFSYVTNITIMSEIYDGSVECRVGKFSSIGPDCLVLLAEEHRLNWNTTYPFDAMMRGYASEEICSTYSKGSITIGNDVWIGQKATILSGVTIGDGCVIGAQTVVARSLPPYSVAVGNPANIIRQRFASDQIEMLMQMKWWDWPYDKLYQAIPLLQSERIEELYRYWKSFYPGCNG